MVPRDSSAPRAVKELLEEGSSKVLGGAPTCPSQPQEEQRGLLEKLARCGRSHSWLLSTHSLTRTVPVQFLGFGLQLLQLWLGSEASEVSEQAGFWFLLRAGAGGATLDTVKVITPSEHPSSTRSPAGPLRGGATTWRKEEEADRGPSPTLS